MWASPCIATALGEPTLANAGFYKSPSHRRVRKEYLTTRTSRGKTCSRARFHSNSGSSTSREASPSGARSCSRVGQSTATLDFPLQQLRRWDLVLRCCRCQAGKPLPHSTPTQFVHALLAFAGPRNRPEARGRCCSALHRFSRPWATDAHAAVGASFSWWHAALRR